MAEAIAKIIERLRKEGILDERKQALFRYTINLDKKEIEKSVAGQLGRWGLFVSEGQKKIEDYLFIEGKEPPQTPQLPYLSMKLDFSNIPIGYGRRFSVDSQLNIQDWNVPKKYKSQIRKIVEEIKEEFLKKQEK